MPKPKGRQLDESALADVKNLLAERAIRRDHLIEYLHLLQDKYGCLHAKQSYLRWKGRLMTRQSALALNRFQHR